MTIRAGRAFGDEAAPNGGTGAMEVAATEVVCTTATALMADQAVPLEFARCQAADGHATVDVRGELDIATADRAHAYLRGVVDSEEGEITLNLAGLAFCDAAGLSVLARVAGHARRTGRSVRLAAVRPSLARIMRITGLDETFPEVRAPVLTTAGSPRQSGSSAG